MIFTSESLSIGQTFTHSDEYQGKTFAFRMTITQLGPKQVTVDYSCSIDGSERHPRTHKIKRTTFVEMVNGSEVYITGIGICQGQWALEGALFDEAQLDELVATEAAAELAAQGSEATRVTVYNLALGTCVMRKVYTEPAADNRAEAMRVAREWAASNPSYQVTICLDPGTLGDVDLKLAEALLAGEPVQVADEPAVAEGAYFECPECGDVTEWASAAYLTCPSGHSFAKVTAMPFLDSFDVLAEPVHTPAGMAYAEAMGATQCDSCDAILMGSEQLGTTCNHCLELRGAIAERQRLKARVAELGAEVSQVSGELAQAEARVIEAGDAYVSNMELTELGALGRAYIARKRLADVLNGLRKLLASAKDALEAVKARCKALDHQAAEVLGEPLPNRMIGPELAAAQDALIAAERAVTQALAKHDPPLLAAACNTLGMCQQDYAEAMARHTAQSVEVTR